MTCKVCGRICEDSGGGPGLCGACGLDEPTLTLWLSSLSVGSTAMDSIRSAGGPGFEIDPDYLPLRRIRSETDETGGPADFALKEKLGSGGMGEVYSARQTLFRRPVAIKMVHSSRSGTADTTRALMTEAVVTGRLDHPNVVPVHDLCTDESGNIFFVMKEVHGQPWSLVMPDRSLEENLDILLRVADTVSYAHSKGILHRDLKPQNIMIGEFGEVMVMDWGACCLMPDASEAVHYGDLPLCGTPAYMPPESARGDRARQGPASDVYLLGAMLYEVLAGHPPRQERDPALALSMAAENLIEPLPRAGELERIALRAMETAPSDRFADVSAFQRAIREYRTHAAGRQLAGLAERRLEAAVAGRDYALFNQAIYGLQQAAELSPGFAAAEALLCKARAAYADCAISNGDYELAQSLLDPENEAHRALLEIVQRAIRERDAQRRRNRRLLGAFRLLLAALLLLFAAAFFLVRAQRQEAVVQRMKADAALHSSLLSLIDARFGEQNHEAVMAAFRQLHDRFGLDGIDEEHLLMIRIAAAMTPWRGAVDLGPDPVLGMVQARGDEGSIWIVGTGSLRRVELDLDAGWVAGSETAIFAHSFGTPAPPGRVVESMPLSFRLNNAGAFFEDGEGTLWVGGGTVLYRYDREASAWQPVLDVAALDFEPVAFEEYGADPEREAEDLAWLQTEGRRQPINGVRITADRSRAALALGGGAVCWVDLNDLRVLGWMHANMFLGSLGFKPARQRVRLELSPDERTLIYVEGINSAVVMAFNAEPFCPKAVYYTRDFAVQDLFFCDTDRFLCVSKDGLVFAIDRDQIDSYSPEGLSFSEDAGRWGLERYLLRRFDLQNLAPAALSRDGRHLVMLSGGGLLQAGPVKAGLGYGMERSIVQRKYTGAILTRSGQALLLDDAAQLHVYDTRTYSICSFDPGGPIRDLQPGGGPVEVGYVRCGGGPDMLCAVNFEEISRPKKTMRAFPTGRYTFAALDPLGRWYATMNDAAEGLRDRQSVALYDRESGDQLAVYEIGICNRFRFSEDGEYLICGGNWSREINVFSVHGRQRVGYIPQQREGGFSSVCLDQQADPPRLIAASKADWELTARPLGGSDEIEPDWSRRTSGITMAIVPFRDSESGRALYWCRTWFGAFEAHDARTGDRVEALDQTYWYMKSIRLPHSTSFCDKVAFCTDDGRLQLCLKQDLYPLFDSGVLGFKVQEVAMSPDASVLFLHGADGRIHVMRMPPAATP